MSFRTRATVAAFFVFALVSAARGQAPVQTSSQATALPPDDEFYSLRGPAAAGDAQAQFALANHYFYGVGVPQDYSQALLWYNKSANQGFAPAQNLLGYMYQHKFGVPRDYKRAPGLLPFRNEAGLCVRGVQPGPHVRGWCWRQA